VFTLSFLNKIFANVLLYHDFGLPSQPEFVQQKIWLMKNVGQSVDNWIF